MSNTNKYPWGHDRRFNSWREYCRRELGGRIQKVVVNAGFSCPNRDGRLGTGGCSFCNNEGFSPSYCHTGDSIIRQIDMGINFLDKRYKKPENYAVYFQSYSNTYAPLEVLQERYQQALAHPRIMGLIIGTRPDCIDEDKLDYLAHLGKTKFVSIEYGVESCYNKTLERVNRGHTYEESVRAIEMTSQRGIHIGGHFIFGLPGETPQMMLEQSKMISQLPLNTVKFHQLQIVKGTSMASDYARNPDGFFTFSLKEYVDFITSFAERLRPDIIIERFSGEVPPRLNAGPSWGRIRSDQVLKLIEKEFEARGSWQGKLWKTD